MSKRILCYDAKEEIGFGDSLPLASAPWSRICRLRLQEADRFLRRGVVDLLILPRHLVAASPREGYRSVEEYMPEGVDARALVLARGCVAILGRREESKDLAETLLYRIGGSAALIQRAVRARDIASEIMRREQPVELWVMDGMSSVENALVRRCRSVGIRVLSCHPLWVGKTAAVIAQNWLFKRNYERDEISLLGADSRGEAAIQPHRLQDPILFFVTYQNHLRPMEGVAKALTKRRKESLFILPRAAKEWKAFQDIKRDFPNLFYEDFVNEAVLRQMQHAQQEGIQWWKEDRPLLKRLFDQEGNLWGCVEKGLRTVYYSYFPRAVAYARVSRTILEATKPSVCVGVHAKRSVDQIFFRAAQKEYGSKIVFVSVSTKFEPSIFHCGEMDLADLILCTGEQDRQITLRHWPISNPSKLLTVGHPGLDGLFHSSYRNLSSEKAKEEILRSVSIHPDSDKKWILFPIGYHSLSEIRAIAKTVLSFKEAFLLVKVHPGYSKSYYTKNLKQISKEVIVLDEEYSLPLLLKAADGIVCGRSSVSIEAVLFQRPLIAFTFHASGGRHPLLDYPGLVEVKTVAELHQALGDLLEGRCPFVLDEGTYRQFAMDHVGSWDGKAAERVAQLLLQQTRQQGEFLAVPAPSLASQG